MEPAQRNVLAFQAARLKAGRMPLIVFIGISSLGALFLIVFVAHIFREERETTGFSTTSAAVKHAHRHLRKF